VGKPVAGWANCGHDECTTAQCSAACAYGSFGDSAGSQPRGERAVALWMSEEQRSTASPERKTKAVPE
jgi:hypothetical protein